MLKHAMLSQRAASGLDAWRLPGLLTLGAALSAAVGAACFLAHHEAATTSGYRASAGLVILLAAILQLRTAWIVWRTNRYLSERLRSRLRFFARAMFVGVVLAYLAALVAGPQPGVKEAFFAAVIVWYTLLVAPLAALPETLQSWRRLVDRRVTRRTVVVVYWLLLVVVNLEIVARAWTMLAGASTFSNNAAVIAEIPAVSLAEKVLPSVVDSAPCSFQSGTLRVAVLGDEMTLCGTRETNHVTQLENLVPGLRVLNCGRPNATPRDYARWASKQVGSQRPDLVLVFVSVGDDITAASETKSPFDWQSLGVSQLVQDSLRDSQFAEAAEPAKQPADVHGFLRTQGQQLTVCRSPISDEMHRCWKQSLHHLTRVVERCRQEQVPVALVLVPAEFQVNKDLCDTLRRRLGYEPSQIDLELPQRRLTAFAQQHGIAAFDLLPHLRRCEESPYLRNNHLWNSTGNAAAARALSGWLQSRYSGQLAAAQLPRQ